MKSMSHFKTYVSRHCLTLRHPVWHPIWHPSSMLGSMRNPFSLASLAPEEPCRYMEMVRDPEGLRKGGMPHAICTGMKKQSFFLANGSSIELRNCATEASERMATHNAQVQAQVDEAVKLGSFVVVEFYPWYCKSTDAVVGEGMVIRQVLLSRELAYAWANAAYKQGMFDPDNRVVVFPREPEPVDLGYDFASGEEVPF